MCTLAHVFEQAGLATVALGSIQSQIMNTAPPRGLWCDFPLGRPLGKPDDPEFQHRVIAHALDLLERAKAPVVEEFPEAIADDGASILACPLPPRSDPQVHPAVDEARGLRAAYDRAVKRLGNRMGAVRTVQADDIPAAIEAFVRVAEGKPWKEAGIPGIPARVVQDIRGYYETAALELVDHTPAAWEATRWFIRDSEAGRAIAQARLKMRDSGAKQPIWFYLLPGDS
ncbi:MAG: hypothetical protein V3V67_06890 [Myxococcota bacterium]